MSFRSRPVLDRKHRPRWQDELRTQQLTVIAFAVAIALALGIFGAAAWNGYWESHFRPVAAVAGTTYDRSDLDERERILVAEASAAIAELQAQLGGPRDEVIQQQIDQISLQLSSLDTNAADSLVESAVRAARAGDFEVSVTDEELETGLAERFALHELVRAQLILLEALPTDAAPDAEPSDEQREAARGEAQAALDRLEAGEAFAEVATEVSDDTTAQTGGLIGWFAAQDASYGEYFEPLADADPGDLVGPIETARGGYAVLGLLDRRDATTESPLRELLRRQEIEDGMYREYVRGELLVDAYRGHFADEVVSSPAPQRRVAQIFIAAATGAVVPQERARHVLVNPLPADAAEGTEATDEQLAAALAEAEEVRELLAAADADWYAIAGERSDDPGSGARGGDLGWYDPEVPQFVEQFTAALAELEVGELSEPVRTEFGYHVIEKTGERLSPQTQAADLVEELRADPDSFPEVATTISEDAATAQEGGELGWVAPYQLDEALEEIVFGLEQVGEVSEPYEGGEGITIYQLLELSDSREIEGDRLEEIRSSGFDRWLEQEVRAPVETWLDPEFAPSTAA